MSTLGLVVTVSRTALSLGPLGLQDPGGGFEIESFDPGSTEWSKQMESSPFWHGEYVVHERKTNPTFLLTVLVSASTPSTLDTRHGLLKAAFTGQRSYTLSGTLQGQPFSFKALRADRFTAAPNGIDKARELVNYRRIQIEAQRHPTATSGPW